MAALTLALGFGANTAVFSVVNAVLLLTLFVTAMRLQQANLTRALNVDRSPAASDIYLIDIQKVQRPGVETAVKRLTGAGPRLIPIVRTRLVEIKRSLNNPLRQAPMRQVEDGVRGGCAVESRRP